jgi:hypothetical protein
MVYIDLESCSRWKEGNPWSFLGVAKEEGVKFWLEVVTKLRNSFHRAHRLYIELF